MLQHPRWYLRLCATVLVVFCATYSGLVLTAPVEKAALASVLLASQTGATAPTARGLPPVWPAVFGINTQAEIAPPAKIPSDISFEIRGVITDGDRNWALIDGTAVARIGDTLRGEYTIVSIGRNGIEVMRAGEVFFVPNMAFNDPFAPLSQSGQGAAPSSPVTEVDVTLGQITSQTVARALARGGSLGPIDPDTKYAPIKWVRPNQLYDIIGLRAGDIITSVNNQSIAEGKFTRETLENAVDTGTLRFDILAQDESRKRIVVRLR